MIYKDYKECLKQKPLPRFSIIVSDSKKANTEIAYCLAGDMQVVIGGNKVEEVREVVNLAYKQSVPTVYLFLDADNLSASAKNALLKVTEEPPRKSYFIMCLSSTQNTLNTILSRGTIFHLPQISIPELVAYAKQKNKKINDRDIVIISRFCTTLEQVDTLLKLKDMSEMVDFVQKVVDNLSFVTITNALKILNSLNFKDDEDKYDLQLFLNMFIELVLDSYIEEEILSTEQLNQILVNTLEVRNKLKINSVNKLNIMELWIMDEWEIFGGENIE